MDKKNRPDAILGTETNIRHLLIEADYRVPEDVAVAAVSLGISDVDAGIVEDAEEVGCAAVKTLIALIQRGEFGIPEHRHNVLVRGKWQDGASLPDRR
jgi:LacI family transcriptional regulator